MEEKKSGTKINSFYAKRYNKNIAGKSSTLGDGTLTEGLTAKHKMKLVLNAIKKNFVKKTKISLVDFGGVYGSMRLFKENLGAKVYSVNVTAEQLVDCENKIICDITKQVPLPDDSFDVVVCLDTMEHLIEPDLVIQNAYRILKNDGIFVITVPNLASFVNRFSLLFGFMPTNYCPTEKRYGTLFGVKDSSWHKSVMTSGALSSLLKEHNFITKEITGFSYSYNKSIQLVNSIFPSSFREGLCITAQKEKKK